MYVYVVNKDLDGFAVGHYSPGGKFVAETTYPEKDAAAERVHYLNGGVNPELFDEIVNHLYALVSNINFLVEDLNQRLDCGWKPVGPA
jgi:hypothetical protein